MKKSKNTLVTLITMRFVGVVLTRGHIFRGEFVGRVGNEETRLAHGTVTHHHAFDRLHLCR